MSFTGDRSGVLRSLSGGDVESATPASATPSGAPRPGETLELGAEATRYQIVRSLGTGGYAEVFLARRLGPAGLSRPVALKCILKGLDVHERTRRAFVYEAQLASKLRHSNIAQAYDLAVLGERYFLVLEYVDGVTVRAVLRAAREATRRLSEAFCCHVAASVAEALYYAHTLADEDGRPLGIVHRDVTAVNLMVARSGAVKLLDFGAALARIEGRERTRTGQFRGTCVYASPEQALGEPLDGRSDLFSLGVVLVEMLTGIRVFDAETDMGTMRKIAECSREDLRAVTATLPPELAAICLKALARTPGDRFQDGAQFSHALREYLTANGITYGPSECAAEMESLGAFADVHDDESVSKGIAEDAPDATSSHSVAPSTNSLPHSYVGGERVTAALGTGTVGPRRSVWRPRLLAAVAVATVPAAIVGTGWDKLPWRSHRQASTPVAEVAAPPLAGTTRAPETLPAADLRPEPAPVAMSTESDVRSEAEPIVRPKRRTSGARTATTERKPEPQPVQRDRSSSRISSPEFVDRPTVSSPRATLPRGTLVPVKLVQTLSGPNPGRAEAVVTEEVSAEGVLVPKGSSVSCSARPPADGRVALACDTISTSDRVLMFSGVAVGEGQHVGLRLLDDEIAAGTPFVVYVNAPAALR